MNVVFYYTAETPEDPMQRITAAIAMESVRRNVPGARIVHLTDQVTTKLAGPCELVRVHASGRCAAHIEFKDPALFLDTDIVVQRDIREAFSSEADVTVVKSLHPTRPYNGGVVFCRNPAVLRMVKKEGESEIALAKVVDSGIFDVKILPNEYNYTPEGAYENTSSKAILHYKGQKKDWMLTRHISV